MSKFTKILACFVALAMLGGCGYQKAAPNPLVSAIGSMAKAGVAKAKPRKAAAGKEDGGKAVSPKTRRAQLQKAGQPIMRVSSQTLGQAGLMRVRDTKGPVLTWAVEGATFSQRNGVVIQTRGLGADLMSAQAPSGDQLLGAGSAYQRVYYFLGGDDQGTRRTYDCTTTVVGRETIEIMARSHVTTHVRETCSRSLSKLTNDYWFEGSMIRKSRQWVSAGVGYVEFERIID